MSQYVLQFGSRDVTKLAEIVAHELTGTDLAIEILDREHIASLTYRLASESISQAMAMIKTGGAASIIARPNRGSLRYALIVPPNFNGQELSLWSATLEWTNLEWQEVWHRLLNSPALRFITVGFEEGVVVSDRLLSVERFPWTTWPTVVAALRSDTGDEQSWIVRSNPNASAVLRE